MKKSLLSVFTMVAMAAAFTACSNDDIEVPDGWTIHYLRKYIYLTFIISFNSPNGSSVVIKSTLSQKYCMSSFLLTVHTFTFSPKAWQLSIQSV